MRQVKRTRTLPLVITVVLVISIIIALSTPFLYASLVPTSIVGFCLIFGGTYSFKGNTPIIIDFNWHLFGALMLLVVAAVFSVFCRKWHRSNTLITFLLVLVSTLLFAMSYRFCTKVIDGNLGYSNSCYISCGPFIVMGFNGLALLICLVDMIKKR